MLELESLAGDVSTAITDLIRQDMRVHLLYLMPRHKDFVFDKSWLAVQTKLETREVHLVTSRLLQIGLWVMNADGGVSISDPELDIVGGATGDLSVPDYMTLASQ